MDFQKAVDSIAAMTCVVSVEKLKEGGYGKIRLVTGNRAYIDSLENPANGTEMLSRKFVPNMEYTEIMTRDLNFEDFCYRSAVEGKCLHSYAHPERMDLWFNMTFLPLTAGEDLEQRQELAPGVESVCYCTYTMEINFEPSSERMSNVSGELASAVLETCLMLYGSEDFRATIEKVIHEIRQLCASRHCCILLLDQAKRSCDVLCESFDDPSNPHPMEAQLDESFYDLALTWEDTISGSNCLIVRNQQQWEVVKERNPRWYASLKASDTDTIALFPLRSRNDLLGYLWAAGFDPDRAGKVKETLELTSFILSSEINTWLMVDQLRLLSSRDMLTGLLNRNEMNNYVDRLYTGPNEEKESVGIVFADLNGLKLVNDGEGHAAGDRLLRNATAALRQVFSDQEIYRAGGDEFVMILPGADMEDIRRRTDALHRAAAGYDKVSFAVGSSLEPDRRDIHRALRLADERMYEDKEAYYARFPEKRRQI